jgi:hypothetical protein
MQASFVTGPCLVHRSAIWLRSGAFHFDGENGLAPIGIPLAPHLLDDLKRRLFDLPGGASTN